MGSTGQGSLSNQQKAPAAPAPIPPGPPFVAGSAYNGLSVDPVTGKIVLGNDAGLLTAMLLSNRDLPLNNFLFQMIDGINRKFIVDPANERYSLGDIDGSLNGGMLGINHFSPGTIFLGDDNWITTGAEIYLNITTPQFYFADKLGTYLNLQPASGDYRIGDINTTLNGTFFHINDLLQTAKILSGAGNNYLSLDVANMLYQLGDINGSNTGTTLTLNDAVQYSEIVSGSGKRLVLDAANGLYQIGDIDGFGNSWVMGIDDSNQEAYIGDTFGVTTGTEFFISFAGPTFQMNDNGGDYFFIGNANAGISPRDYQLGDINAQHNGTALMMDDSLQTVKFINGATANQHLLLDIPNAIYQLGDIDSSNNSSRLTIDDTQVSLMFSNGGPGSRFLDLNTTPDQFLIGDIDNVASNMFLFINGAGNRISTNGFAEMIGTTTAYTNNAAAALGTLANAPVAGNPTKWIPINDNGTIRNIPAW